MKYFLVSGLALLLCACSNRQIYTAVQQNRQQECSKLPQVRFEQCMQDYEASYDDYARERQEILDEEMK